MRHEAAPTSPWKLTLRTQSCRLVGTDRVRVRIASRNRLDWCRDPGAMMVSIWKNTFGRCWVSVHGIWGARPSDCELVLIHFHDWDPTPFWVSEWATQSDRGWQWNINFLHHDYGKWELRSSRGTCQMHSQTSGPISLPSWCSICRHVFQPEPSWHCSQGPR